MKVKTRAPLVLFLLLAAQLACRSPLPGQNGAGSQLPGLVYTITSVPPFPTAISTPRPSPTVTVTSSPSPTRTPTRTATLPPTLSARLPATQPVSLTPALRPRPIAPVIARYLSNPPTLDGDWSEWKDKTDEYPANIVVWGSKKWDGPEDLSSSFHVGWDDKFLYLAIKVRDDLYVQNTTRADLYNGDSLELLLDTQLMEDYLSTNLSDDDFQLGLSPGRPRAGIEQEAYLWAPNWLAGQKKNIQIEARQESGLYRVEAAIPWTVLEMKPVAGMHYGFAISVSDNDNGDGSVQQSMVSNLPDRDPGDPTTWGYLQLAK
jgi:hypothetical protein